MTEVEICWRADSKALTRIWSAGSLDLNAESYLTSIESPFITFHLLRIVSSEIIHHCLRPIDRATSSLITRYSGKS